LFGLFKPKKPMDRLVLEGLESFGIQFDPLYDSYFQDPKTAKLACALGYVNKTEDLPQRWTQTQNFIHNFYSFLEKKSRKMEPEQFLGFLALTYRIYDRLAQKTENSDISPHTPIKSLDLENSGIVTLASYLKKNTGFRPEIDDRHLDKAPRKKLTYLIETCASGNTSLGL